MVGVGARRSGPELVGISVPGLFQSGRAGCARLSLLIQSHRQRRQGFYPFYKPRRCWTLLWSRSESTWDDFPLSPPLGVFASVSSAPASFLFGYAWFSMWDFTSLTKD